MNCLQELRWLYDRRDLAEARRDLAAFAGRFQTKYPSIGITVRRDSQGKYQIYKDEKVYIPVFEIEFSIVSLRSLTIELANYLAQPTIDHWDGKTIQRLVA
jgi:transposase-like protein